MNANARATARLAPAGPQPERGPCACGAGRRAPDDLRCGCGSLLARRVEGGVELKCRRCKRSVVLRLGGG